MPRGMPLQEVKGLYPPGWSPLSSTDKGVGFAEKFLAPIFMLLLERHKRRAAELRD